MAIAKMKGLLWMDAFMENTTEEMNSISAKMKALLWMDAWMDAFMENITEEMNPS
jgi:hypothetical protein